MLRITRCHYGFAFNSIWIPLNSQTIIALSQLICTTYYRQILLFIAVTFFNINIVNCSFKRNAQFISSGNWKGFLIPKWKSRGLLFSQNQVHIFLFANGLSYHFWICIIWFQTSSMVIHQHIITLYFMIQWNFFIWKWKERNIQNRIEEYVNPIYGIYFGWFLLVFSVITVTKILRKRRNWMCKKSYWTPIKWFLIYSNLHFDLIFPMNCVWSIEPSGWPVTTYTYSFEISRIVRDMIKY